MPLPVQDAQADQLVKLLAGGGAPGTGGAPGSAPPPTPTSTALKGASSQLDGANPNGTAQVLNQMSSDLAQIYLMSATNFPDASKDIDTARQALGRVQKILGKMSQAQAAIAPIVNSAGIGPTATAQNGQPDISALLGM